MLSLYWLMEVLNEGDWRGNWRNIHALRSHKTRAKWLRSKRCDCVSVHMLLGLYPYNTHYLLHGGLLPIKWLLVMHTDPIIVAYLQCTNTALTWLRGRGWWETDWLQTTAIRPLASGGHRSACQLGFDYWRQQVVMWSWPLCGHVLKSGCLLSKRKTQCAGQG